MTLPAVFLTRAVRGALDVIFPPSCVHCREVVSSDGELRHLCDKCLTQLNFVQAPHCSTCGHPFYGVVEGERLCPHCEGLVPAFREGRTAILMKGPGRTLVHELKYHAGLHVLHDIEHIFRRCPRVLELSVNATLVPVPLHPRKQRERGYNQSQLIAEHLARAVGGDTRVRTLLKRIVDTDSQTHHDRRERQSNLKNAFAPASDAALSADLHYVLVDDVFTTGSTLNSCAHTMRRAGAINLDVVTFGHG
ncbi:MAG: ComF family protein [Opitutus sp.]